MQGGWAGLKRATLAQLLHVHSSSRLDLWEAQRAAAGCGRVDPAPLHHALAVPHSIATTPPPHQHALSCSPARQGWCSTPTSWRTSCRRAPATRLWDTWRRRRSRPTPGPSRCGTVGKIQPVYSSNPSWASARSAQQLAQCSYVRSLPPGSCSAMRCASLRCAMASVWAHTGLLRIPVYCTG